MQGGLARANDDVSPALPLVVGDPRCGQSNNVIVHHSQALTEFYQPVCVLPTAVLGQGNPPCADADGGNAMHVDLTTACSAKRCNMSNPHPKCPKTVSVYDTPLPQTLVTP